MYAFMKTHGGHERDLLGLRIRSLRIKKGWTQQESYHRPIPEEIAFTPLLS